GVFLGQHLAWQASFGLVAVLAAVSLIIVLVALPEETPEAGGGNAGRWSGLRGLARPQVALGAVPTALTGMAAPTVVTSLAPFLTRGSGVGSSSIVWVMLAYGAGCVLGNTVGGRLADGRVAMAMAMTVTGTLVVLALLALASGHAIGSIVFTVLVGTAYFAT